MVSITAFTYIMDHYYLCRISGLSDLPVLQLWYTFMSGALSFPWDLVLELNPGAAVVQDRLERHRAPPCASQLPSVQANYLLVLETYYLYLVLL